MKLKTDKNGKVVIHFWKTKYRICLDCDHYKAKENIDCENCNACSTLNGFGCDRYKKRKAKINE